MEMQQRCGLVLCGRLVTAEEKRAGVKLQICSIQT